MFSFQLIWAHQKQASYNHTKKLHNSFILAALFQIVYIYQSFPKPQTVSEMN
jgi:hypothetical protein